VYSLLEDEQSRLTFINYINSIVSDTPDPEQTQKLFDEGHYCPEHVCSLGPEEVIVDCGAYDGDSLRLFHDLLGSFKWYYAFEPDPDNYKGLKDTAERRAINNITLMNAGIGAEVSTHGFLKDQMLGSSFSETGDTIVAVKTIDNVLEHTPSYIKMDVQGFEMDGLIGGQSAIRKHKPKLAICIYHKPVDLFKIPLFIHELNPDYRFYVRHHHPDTLINTVFYAV
jgi:FkbM family methyltransferase